MENWEGTWFSQHGRKADKGNAMKFQVPVLSLFVEFHTQEEPLINQILQYDDSFSKCKNPGFY